MNIEIYAILTFHLIVVFSTGCFYFSIKNYLLTVISSALFTTITYQIIGYFVIGCLDPFVIFATIFSFVYATILSSALAAIFLFIQKKLNKTK